MKPHIIIMSIQVVYLQPYYDVPWLVPREAAAVSAHVLCTPYNHAPVYSVTSYSRKGHTRVYESSAFDRMTGIFYVPLR